MDSTMVLVARILAGDEVRSFRTTVWGNPYRDDFSPPSRSSPGDAGVAVGDLSTSDPQLVEEVRRAEAIAKALRWGAEPVTVVLEGDTGKGRRRYSPTITVSGSRREVYAYCGRLPVLSERGMRVSVNGDSWRHNDTQSAQGRYWWFKNPFATDPYSHVWLTEADVAGFRDLAPAGVGVTEVVDCR